MNQYYLGRAIEALDHFGKELSNVSVVSTTMRSLSREISEAQRWQITPDALKLVWNTDLSNDILAEARPPHPIIAIEYDFSFDLLNLTFDAPPKSEFQSFAECAPRVTVVFDSEDAPGGGITVFNFFKHPAQKLWNLVPYVVRLRRDEMSKITELLPNNLRTSPATLPISPVIPSVPFEELARRAGVETDALIKGLTHHAPMLDDTRVALGLIQILCCTNAPVRREPAPKKLNEKRKKTGKPQIPEYRILHLTREMVEAKGYPSEEAVQGARKSPRRHIRRGHIHRWRLANGGFSKKWLPPKIICPWNDDEITGPIRVVP